MLNNDEYRKFQDMIFQEIADLEAEGSRLPITMAVQEYGLTLDEAARLYYQPGMTGQQFLDAIKADRQKG